jgi:mRNA-degrading endonuclease toxin of MazEF toxin-antitoxin module
VLVLSENDWNDWSGDCVIVPLYPSGVHGGTLLRVSTTWGTADCTRIVSVNNTVLTAYAGQGEPAMLAGVRAGVRSFLCIDDLRVGRDVSTSNSGLWYPRWTYIYYRRTPISGARKMHAVLSDDAWNSQLRSVSAARLTSKSKSSRLRWGVPVKGGPVVVGDLHILAVGGVIQDPPSPPRPQKLTKAEMADMADALGRLLSL